MNYNVLETFINHCDDMTIADEGFTSTMGKSLHDLFSWVIKMISDFWNKLMAYVTSIKHDHSNDCTCHLKKSASFRLATNIMTDTDIIFDNMDLLVEVLHHKYDQISKALFNSDDLRYDSKEVAYRAPEDITRTMETKYSGINRRCISHIPDEIKYDYSGKGLDVRKAVTDIYDKLSNITELLEQMKKNSTPDEYDELYKQCNYHLMEIFIRKVQNLKPLKESLNDTIKSLNNGVPIYSGNVNYSKIIHKLISDASADWLSLNNLFVRINSTFKSHDNQPNNDVSDGVISDIV
jgi:hypothetical protein